MKVSPDHFKENHPGPITNSKDLCEEDAQKLNLFGTNSIKGLDACYIDKYVNSNKNTQYDMYMFNEELWNFLFSRYGGDAIKRYWTRLNDRHFTSVEAKLQPLRVQFLNCQLLETGDFDKNMYKEMWTQISQNAYLKDLKWRLVDSLNSAGYNLTIDDIRLWLYNAEHENTQNSLGESCAKVTKSFKETSNTSQ